MWSLICIPVAAALTLDAPASEDLVDTAEQAVRGVVVSVDAERTAAGIVTTYNVEVEETLRGPREAFVAVRVPGGTDGELVQRVAGVPVWEEGDDVLVLLDDGRARLSGLYTVEHQRVVDPLGRPGQPRHIAELEERILYPSMAPDRAHARRCLNTLVEAALADGWSLRRSWTVSVRGEESLTERAQLYPGSRYRLLVCAGEGIEGISTSLHDEQGVPLDAGDDALSWTMEQAGSQLLHIQTSGLRSRQRGALGVALLWR